MNRLIRLTSTLIMAATCIGLMALSPSGAAAAECTDTWTGPSEGKWQTAENWSTKKVPTSSDVACIPEKKVAKVESGTAQEVGVVQGEGKLVLSENTLELTNTTEASSIALFQMKFNGNLKGAGTLHITKEFEWWASSTMSGTGSTILNSGASGTTKTGAGWATISERTFINEGSYSVNEGVLVLSAHGKFENRGTLTVNHEEGLHDILAEPGLGTVVNSGTLRKTSGTGETQIEADFENSGTIEAQTGHLQFSEAKTTGTLSSGSVLKGAIAIKGPAVTAENVDAKAASLTLREASISVSSGDTMSIGTQTLEYKGVLKGAGTFEIINSLPWEGCEAVMSGGGKTILKSGLTGTIGGCWDEIKERTVVNEGTLTLTRTLGLANGATFENVGTFKANSQETFGLWKSAGPAESSFINTGTLKKTEGTGTTWVRELHLVNSGRIAVETTGEIFFEREGSVTLEASSTLEGKLHFENQSITGQGFKATGGRITIRESSISLTGSNEIEQLDSLYKANTSGSGTLTISKEFEWAGQLEFSGTGKTVVGPKAVTNMKAGATTSTLAGGWTFVTQGTFNQLENSRLKLKTGATLHNQGTYNLNAEPYPLWSPKIIESEGPAHIVNDGTVKREEGTTNVTVTPEFENHNVLIDKSSNIEIEHPINLAASNHAGSDCHTGKGDPVECATGNFTETQTDIEVGGLGVGLDLVRSYSAQAAAKASSPGAFGYGWTNSFSDHLTSEESGSKLTLTQSDGSTVPSQKPAAPGTRQLGARTP
jgi:Domain of unknown function (DUF6531)